MCDPADVSKEVRNVVVILRTSWLEVGVFEPPDTDTGLEEENRLRALVLRPYLRGGARDRSVSTRSRPVLSTGQFCFRVVGLQRF